MFSDLWDFQIFSCLMPFLHNWLLYLIWLFLSPSGRLYVILFLNKNLFFLNDAVWLSSTLSHLLGSQHSYSAYTKGRYRELASFLIVQSVQGITHRPVLKYSNVFLKQFILEVVEVWQPNLVWWLVTVISTFYLCTYTDWILCLSSSWLFLLMAHLAMHSMENQYFVIHIPMSRYTSANIS